MTCGACCRGDAEWVRLQADDDARIASAPALAALVVTTTSRGYVKRSLRMVEGHCAALARTPHGVACTVYDDRPSVCRELTAGSADCQNARAQALEPPRG